VYLVKLQHFNGAGHLLGEETICTPGKEPSALRDYIRNRTGLEFCGFKPAYTYAAPETGEAVLVKIGGADDSESLRGWFL
jgi:hypothetical protein